MRKNCLWLVGLGLMLFGARKALAQQQPASFLPGVTPQNIVFQPINLNNVVAPPPPSIVQQPKSFSLTSIFPNIQIPFLTRIFARNQSPPPVFPGQQPDAIGPLLPTFSLPAPQPDGIHPLLPFTPNQ